MGKNEIKPVELCIECDEVVKRYKVTEAIEIVRCKTAIFLHATGFFVVSRPTLANNLKGGALFETLQWYCDYMDKRDEYNAEDQEAYDAYAAMIVNALTLPMDVFTDMDFCIAVSTDILHKRNEYYERLQKQAAEPHQETLEDALANAAFEGEVLAGEQIKKELGELAEKTKSDGTES